jgi:adenylate cyclase class 2
MQVEYEATFYPVDKNQIRGRLQRASAALIKPETLMKRVVFLLPQGHEIKGGWLRVRNEGDRTTMSIKVVDGEKIEDQKEICLAIDDFEQGRTFLASIGCVQKAYQESRREIWTLDDVEVCLDEWPHLEPFVEVEGKSEMAVKAVSEKLGFDWAQAKFCAVATLYNQKYGTSIDVINNHTPSITFAGENPFARGMYYR